MLAGYPVPRGGYRSPVHASAATNLASMDPSQAVVSEIPPPSLAISGLNVYVDGACPNNHHGLQKTSKAGWGFVVYNQAHDRLVDASGPVVLDDKSPAWIGADVLSNNT
eukprot:2365714-Karenia_brevis.AAC.1